MGVGGVRREARSAPRMSVTNEFQYSPLLSHVQEKVECCRQGRCMVFVRSSVTKIKPRSGPSRNVHHHVKVASEYMTVSP